MHFGIWLDVCSPDGNLPGLRVLIGLFVRACLSNMAWVKPPRHVGSVYGREASYASSFLPLLDHGKVDLSGRCVQK